MEINNGNNGANANKVTFLLDSRINEVQTCGEPEVEKVPMAVMPRDPGMSVRHAETNVHWVSPTTRSNRERGVILQHIPRCTPPPIDLHA